MICPQSCIIFAVIWAKLHYKRKSWKVRGLDGSLNCYFCMILDGVGRRCRFLRRQRTRQVRNKLMYLLFLKLLPPSGKNAMTYMQLFYNTSPQPQPCKFYKWQIFTQQNIIEKVSQKSMTFWCQTSLHFLSKTLKCPWNTKGTLPRRQIVYLFNDELSFPYCDASTLQELEFTQRFVLPSKELLRGVWFLAFL